jgi:diguanylate cyclase (GGDEF)-like protein
MAHLINFALLAGEAILYFAVMAGLFRMRRRFGIGIFFCALGTMHFLETYLASILYLQFPFGITVSPGSAVLFSGKLVMLLLLYIREDAAAVRQPIYGLLFGNLLVVGLVALMRFHDVTPTVSDKLPDFQFMNEMGWLMLWGTFLLLLDSILIILIYERSAAWFGERILPRILVSAAAVLTFHHLGFFTALHVSLGVPYTVLYGGWIARMAAGLAYGLLAAAYLRFVETREVRPAERPKLADIFDTLTYRERYEALLEQSGRDSLTGVFDRGRFDRDGKAAVEQAVAGRRAMSILVIDVDHFKSINDHHGHAVGDEVLKQIAREITQATRDTDRVYRYGGEEFIVVCEGLAHGPALLAAERFRLRLAATEIHGLPDRVTASIGVATTPDDGRNLTELFATADGRLYGAKEAGRNRVMGRLIERPDPAPDFTMDPRAARTA